MTCCNFVLLLFISGRQQLKPFSLHPAYRVSFIQLFNQHVHLRDPLLCLGDLVGQLLSVLLLPDLQDAAQLMDKFFRLLRAYPAVVRMVSSISSVSALALMLWEKHCCVSLSWVRQ